MMSKLILLSLFISTMTSAQVENDVDLAKISVEQKTINEWEKDIQKSRAKYKLNIEKKQSEIKLITDTTENRENQINLALKKIDKILSEHPSSKKKSFYKCIKKSLEKEELAKVESCNVGSSKAFNSSDFELIKEWEISLALDSNEMIEKKKTILNELEFNEVRLANTENQIIHAENTKMRLKVSAIDRKLINSNAKFVNCNSSTPDISLEEKIPFPGADFQGPFFGVSHDNQDGLGTCFANTAKNLLISTSKGKDIASFLDLALLHKEEDLSNTGLGGGESCATIERMEKKGYCPQEFAPFERGESNEFSEGLMGTSGNFYDQARLVGLLKDFLHSQKLLQKDNKDLSIQAFGQAKLIIDNLKASPNIKIPLPVARFPIPTDWKLKEMMSIKKTAGFDENKFLEDYKNNYNNFYPEYVKAVMSGTNRDIIFTTFVDKMKPFIDKYSLSQSLDSWKVLFINDTEGDWTNSNRNKEISQSIKFMKSVSGKPDISDEDFIKSCDKLDNNFEFLTTLKPLLEHLKLKGGNSDALFDEKGAFKSSYELMQLVVAPACLGPLNRKMPSDRIMCDQGGEMIMKMRASGKPILDQKKMLRERVLASLLQGYALGNSFEGHINTIVGMRFNSEKEQCEFKIRESQTGESSWQAEENIFQKIEFLTEVRRK